MIQQITATELICNRCGYKWIPRKDTVEEVNMCSRCKSRKWNDPI